MNDSFNTIAQEAEKILAHRNRVLSELNEKIKTIESLLSQIPEFNEELNTVISGEILFPRDKKLYWKKLDDLEGRIERPLIEAPSYHRMRWNKHLDSFLRLLLHYVKENYE